jgi:hypothetical protein
MLSFIRKHPIGIGAAAAVVLAGLAWLAFGFFGVQTLFIDDVVDESGPVFDATPAALETGSAEPAAETTEPAATAPATNSASGDAEPAAEPTAEEADAADPATDDTLPAEEPAAAPTEEAATPEVVTEFVGTFESDAHPTAGTATVLGNGTGQRFLRFENFETDNGPDLNVYLFNANGDRNDYIDLGDLKGNIGDQNYEIPADVDLSVYSEVSVWCVRFGVGFGDALLMAV